MCLITGRGASVFDRPRDSTASSERSFIREWKRSVDNRTSREELAEKKSRELMNIKVKRSIKPDKLEQLYMKEKRRLEV